MSILPIRTFGDPILHQVSNEIQTIDAKVAALAESMIETMYDAPGVGLAGNQIGIQRRIFVYDDGEGAGPRVVINPRIVEREGEELMDEGCLSVPGLSFEVPRALRVHLVGLDLEGNALDIYAEGFQAHIFQHETDHLDGFLLIDRIDEEQRREAKRALRKMSIRATNSNDKPFPLLGR